MRSRLSCLSGLLPVSFLPVFTLEGQAGRLFKPLAYTKTFAMLFAAILSITLVPPLLNLLVRGRIFPEKRHPISRVIMVRGVGSEQAPLLAAVKSERNKSGKLVKYASRFFNFATSVLKMALYRNVVKTDPLERGYISFPKGLPDEYFRQLTAEHRKAVKRRDGFMDAVGTVDGGGFSHGGAA